MSNLYYYRCQNTVSDLKDVLDGFHYGNIHNDRSEQLAASEILDICIEIAEDYGHMTHREFIQNICQEDEEDY